MTKRDENIAAISGEIHTHAEIKELYDIHGTFEVWRLAIDAADAFTAVEQARAEDAPEFDYIIAIEDFSKSVVEQVLNSDSTFIPGADRLTLLAENAIHIQQLVKDLSK